MTLLLILGNLASFGPFVTDFYLPCLPKLADWFSTSASLVQMSLTASMNGLAVGQLLIGPVADKYGRRRPLLWCLAFFVVATVGCIVSPKIHWFVFFRLLQRVTGASGLVISKAMVADLYTGSAMGKFFAALTAIQFISPILAPLLGGVIFNLASWQGIFIVLGMWGLLLLCAGSRLSETLAVEKRLQLPIRKSLTAFLPVLRNRRFMVMNLFQAFVSAVFFSYISASPFLFQHQFGLSHELRFLFRFQCHRTDYGQYACGQTEAAAILPDARHHRSVADVWPNFVCAACRMAFHRVRGYVVLYDFLLWHADTHRQYVGSRF